MDVGELKSLILAVKEQNDLGALADICAECLLTASRDHKAIKAMLEQLLEQQAGLSQRLHALESQQNRGVFTVELEEEVEETLTDQEEEFLEDEGEESLGL